MDELFDFLEQCETELIKQLCLNCPELTYDQIESITKEFNDELNRQLVAEGIINGN